MAKTKSSSVTSSKPDPEARKWFISLRKEMEHRFGALSTTIEDQQGKKWFNERRLKGWKPGTVAKILHVKYLLEAEEAKYEEFCRRVRASLGIPDAPPDPLTAADLV